MHSSLPMIISRYLKASPDLAAVTQHAERLIALQHLFETIAPPLLARSCRVANFKQGKLVLLAANNLLAAKLRQVVPSLTDEFCNKGWQVTAIHVAVQQSGDELQSARPVEPLAPAARARLAELASQVNDSRLRASLEHLLQTAAPEAPAQPDPSAD
jgi:hypothetical protein